MGQQDVEGQTDREKLQAFTGQLLEDIHALETMLEAGMSESGVRRIGAEQELFLVDRSYSAAPQALPILEELDDPAFTTELARFNLEFNLQPMLLRDAALSRLEDDLTQHIHQVRQAARHHGCEVVMTGILPTLSASDLELDNMTPRPRYRALNDAIIAQRGRDHEFQITGVDELIVRHNSVMLEACNTSFQLHFQVCAEEFATLYNIAQLVTAPLLAAAVNSPLLFGRRLWSETRIALFRQAVDTRRATAQRETKGRVSFGHKWVDESVLEIFRQDISRYRVLLGGEMDEKPFEVLDRGEAPRLKALCLHNSTVYRWNRPCYGISEGKPHLRIENRVLPAGPTIADAVANAAFFFGMMSGMSDEYDDIRPLIDFSEVRSNFFSAAQQGLKAQIAWLDGIVLPAQELICEVLLPMAREGLLKRGIDRRDADRFLGILDERVSLGRTGAVWMVDSLNGMGEEGTPGERLAALVAGSLTRQRMGRPLHETPLATIEEAGGWKPGFQRVEQFMTTELITAREDATLELVANLMVWEKIRHVPVENEAHSLLGLVSYRSVFRLLTQQLARETDPAIPVSKIMIPDPITVEPDTSALEAIEIMRARRIGCLPVVRKGELVGILTEADFLNVARELLEDKLRD